MEALYGAAAGVFLLLYYVFPCCCHLCFLRCPCCCVFPCCLLFCFLRCPCRCAFPCCLLLTFRSLSVLLSVMLQGTMEKNGRLHFPVETSTHTMSTMMVANACPLTTAHSLSHSLPTVAAGRFAAQLCVPATTAASATASLTAHCLTHCALPAAHCPP